MSDNTCDALRENLGFMSHLPDNAVDDVCTASEQHLKEERHALESAIEKGISALPFWARGIAKRQLRSR